MTAPCLSSWFYHNTTMKKGCGDGEPHAAPRRRSDAGRRGPVKLEAWRSPQGAKHPVGDATPGEGGPLIFR